jgi:hypothetical protein
LMTQERERNGRCGGNLLGNRESRSTLLRLIT